MKIGSKANSVTVCWQPIIASTKINPASVNDAKESRTMSTDTDTTYTSNGTTTTTIDSIDNIPPARNIAFWVAVESGKEVIGDPEVMIWHEERRLKYLMWKLDLVRESVATAKAEGYHDFRIAAGVKRLIG